MKNFLLISIFASVSFCGIQEVFAGKIKSTVLEEKDIKKSPTQSVPMKITSLKAFKATHPSDYTADENYSMAMKFKNHKKSRLLVVTFLKYAAEVQNHALSALALVNIYSNVRVRSAPECDYAMNSNFGVTKHSQEAAERYAQLAETLKAREEQLNSQQ